MMLMPPMLIPYDAGAAIEGTQEIPTHGIPSPHHSPGPALSLDSASAFNVHHRRRREEELLGSKQYDAIFQEVNGIQQMGQGDELEGMQKIENSEKTKCLINMEGKI